MSATETPISPYTPTEGLVYFARCLNKIRLHAAGRLREDFQANLGKAIDLFLCQYLRIEYGDLKARTLAGGTDEEILAWVRANGRDLSPIDIRIWNHFATKLGWKDDMVDRFAFRKAEAGIEDRADIETIFNVMEVDEGREPRPYCVPSAS